MSDLELSDVDAESWLSDQLRTEEHHRPETSAVRGAERPLRTGSHRPLRANTTGRLHLVLGDSIARRAKLEAADKNDNILKRATGGATWQRVLQNLPKDLEAWRSAARVFGMDRGCVALWLSGNDIYNRFTGFPNKDRDHLNEVVNVASQVVAYINNEKETDIFILGPLP